PAAVAPADEDYLPEQSLDFESAGEPPEPQAYSVDDTQTYSIDELERIAAQADDEPEPTGSYSLPDDDSTLALAGDEPAGETSLGSDEAAATKLELARAYLDMGDVEGARGMLEEVVGEGNPGQRSEARRLLDEIR